MAGGQHESDIRADIEMGCERRDREVVWGGVMAARQFFIGKSGIDKIPDEFAHLATFMDCSRCGERVCVAPSVMDEELENAARRGMSMVLICEQCAIALAEGHNGAMFYVEREPTDELKEAGKMMRNRN